MRFVADESVDYPIVLRLREAGHTVMAIVELDPGLSDADVLAYANQRNNVLLTGDKDFGELVFRDGRQTCGVVLVRLAGLPPIDKAVIVADVVAQYGAQLKGAFSVITPNTVRIRPQH